MTLDFDNQRNWNIMHSLQFDLNGYLEDLEDLYFVNDKGVADRSLHNALVGKIKELQRQAEYLENRVHIRPPVESKPRH